MGDAQAKPVAARAGRAGVTMQPNPAERILLPDMSLPLGDDPPDALDASVSDPPIATVTGDVLPDDAVREVLHDLRDPLAEPPPGRRVHRV
jgi:hypothetical protein